MTVSSLALDSTGSPNIKTLRAIASSDPPINYLSVRQVIDRVRRFYGYSLEQMLGSSRGRELSSARHVAVYLAERLTGKQVSIIARAFNKDHTTILFAVKRIRQRLLQEPALKLEVNSLYNELSQHTGLGELPKWEELPK